MRMASLACRLALLVGVGICILVLGVYGTVFLPNELRQSGIAPAAALPLATVGTLVVLALASALPIRTLFPSHPVRAAVSVGWTPLAAGVLSAAQIAAAGFSARGLVMSVLDGVLCWLAVIAGATLASRMKPA